MKTCRKCNVNKELVEFNKNKKSKDGLSYLCKKCKSENDKLYYDKNKEKIKETATRYYQKNSDTIKQYSKNRNKQISKIDWGDISDIDIVCRICNTPKKAPDMASNKSKKYGKDTVCKLCHVIEVRNYYLRNYEVRKAQRSRRKNKIRMAGGMVRSKDLQILKEHNIKTFGVLTCEYCLISVSEDYYDLEHILAIANGGGSNIENLAISCRDCNGKKSSKLIEDFAPHRIGYFEQRFKNILCGHHLKKKTNIGQT